jgi:hypothetical protein
MGARASGPLMLFVFRTARWVASDATFLTRLMIMSARGRARSKDHERTWRSAVRQIGLSPSISTRCMMRGTPIG